MKLPLTRGSMDDVIIAADAAAAAADDDDDDEGEEEASPAEAQIIVDYSSVSDMLTVIISSHDDICNVLYSVITALFTLCFNDNSCSY